MQEVIIILLNVFIDIGFRIPFLSFISNELGANILLVGYRGFGRSQGTPSENGLKLDGEAIASWAFSNDPIAKQYIDQNNVFLFGRSLGGAVAAHVAVKMKLPFKGIIIENTFSSMGNLVDTLYPMLKMLKDYMLKNKWETINIINAVPYPILFCRSERDELIPKTQMDELYEKAKGAKFKRYYTIKNGTHNEGFLYDKKGYKDALLDFINECNVNKTNESIGKDTEEKESKKDK